MTRVSTSALLSVLMLLSGCSRREMVDRVIDEAGQLRLLGVSLERMRQDGRLPQASDETGWLAHIHREIAPDTPATAPEFYRSLPAEPDCRSTSLFPSWWFLSAESAQALRFPHNVFSYDWSLNPKRHDLVQAIGRMQSSEVLGIDREGRVRSYDVAAIRLELQRER